MNNGWLAGVVYSAANILSAWNDDWLFQAFFEKNFCVRQFSWENDICTVLSYWCKSYFVRYFGSNVYRVGPWEGSLKRLFPVHTLLCLYVRSFLGTLYPLRAYFYGRASFFCPEGCLIARQSKYCCLATQWPCLWNGRWIGYFDAYHHIC